MTDIYPLFADGPAQGQRIKVSRTDLIAGLAFTMEEPLPAGALGEPVPEYGPAPPAVYYRFQRFDILGRTLWIGRCGDLNSLLFDEDRDALFEAITSSRAREAEEERR